MIHLTFEKQGDLLVIELKGEFKSVNGIRPPQFKVVEEFCYDYLATYKAESSAPKIALEVSRCQDFDALILSLFIKLKGLTMRLGGEIVLANVQPAQKEVLKLTRLDSLFSQISLSMSMKD